MLGFAGDPGQLKSFSTVRCNRMEFPSTSPAAFISQSDSHCGLLCARLRAYLCRWRVLWI